MAGIFQADIFCDDCIERIKDDIYSGRFDHQRGLTRDEWEVEHGYDDERCYDSGEYPKWCGDDEESDCPQHCGSHEDCINYGELSDGFRYGFCFGNSLTSDGIEYVREAVRDGEEGGIARDVWAVEYSWIDFDEGDDDDDYDDCGR
jgi:hypothetical protein